MHCQCKLSPEHSILNQSVQPISQNYSYNEGRKRHTGRNNVFVTCQKKSHTQKSHCESSEISPGRNKIKMAITSDCSVLFQSPASERPLQSHFRNILLPKINGPIKECNDRMSDRLQYGRQAIVCGVVQISTSLNITQAMFPPTSAAKL